MARLLFAGQGCHTSGKAGQLEWHACMHAWQADQLKAFSDHRTEGQCQMIRKLLFAGLDLPHPGVQEQKEMAETQGLGVLLSNEDRRTGKAVAEYSAMRKRHVFAGTRDHPPTTEQAMASNKADRLLSPMSRSDEMRAVKCHAFAGNGGHVEACEKIAEEEEAARLLSPNTRTDEKRSVALHKKNHAFASVPNDQKNEAELIRQQAAELMSPMARKDYLNNLATHRKHHAFAGDAPYSEQPAVDANAARLLSNTQTKVGEDLQPYKGQRSTIYIDSGAYSAWTRGVKIDLGKYCAFLKEYADVVDYCFNLDVIPGAAGREASSLERATAIAEGFANWREMRKQGIHSLHTFHYGENVSVLRAIRDEALGEMPAPYMAIGGAAKLEGRDRDLWLQNTVWPELVDKAGVPKLMVHGLGMTDIGTIKAYPWASVDSTSWIFMCSQGKVCLWINGELKTYYASSRHRQGWHDYSEAEKAKLTELLGESNQDFASMKPKDQLLFLMKHNIRELKKLETMIPDVMPASSRPRRRLI